MKKLIFAIVSLVLVSSVSNAQNFKFGHVNMQEVIFLMDEMDSARVVLEKYNQEIQDTYNAMVQEFQTKLATYQQMSANWTRSTVEAKQNELQNLEARLQQYQQSASQDIQNKQQELMIPIQQKAAEAVNKVGKANGFTYIFDTSTGVIPFVDESVSVDVTDLIKAELKISPDKNLPRQ